MECACFTGCLTQQDRCREVEPDCTLTSIFVSYQSVPLVDTATVSSAHLASGAGKVLQRRRGWWLAAPPFLVRVWLHCGAYTAFEPVVCTRWRQG
jgi:hypothetical protein